MSGGANPPVAAGHEPGSRLHLFEGYGVELEYAIVDRESLAVRPIADELLAAAAGRPTSDFEDGPVGWSNELVLHVVELKTLSPQPSLEGWAERFSTQVARIGELLAPLGARLLPGGMHPTMDPARETRLWPHENGEIYAAYDRIFDCRRHGWANLQSTHLNLPFADDDEFGRLHAAVRALMPLLPALAASSPVMDGALTGFADSRLHVYSTHQARIPAAMGAVVPEPVWTRSDYEERIFLPMYRAIAPLDPDGVLQQPFLNARGAIARFERGSIEVRLLDVQETPRADLAIVLLVAALARALVEERWSGIEELRELDTERLAAVLRLTIGDAERARVEDPALLAVLGRRSPLAAGELWRELHRELAGTDAAWRELGPTLDQLLEAGTLSSRLVAALGERPVRGRLEAVWSELADCLEGDRLFRVGP